MSKKEYLEKKITVSTKKELEDAIKHHYGRIIISGDLYVDMKKYFDNYNGAAGLGKGAAKMAGGFILVEIAQLCIPIVGLVISIPALVMFGSSFKNIFTSIKFASYGQRVEENIKLKNESIIIHNDIIEKDRIWMKGAGIVECGDNIDMFNDAIVMKADKVVVSKSKLDLVISSYSNLFYVTDKTKEALANNGVYQKYRVSNDGTNYTFTRIR